MGCALMWINGWIMMFMGVMLLMGEYLCMEVAWRCLAYNQWYVTSAMALLGIGLIATLIGAVDD